MTTRRARLAVLTAATISVCASAWFAANYGTGTVVPSTTVPVTITVSATVPPATASTATPPTMRVPDTVPTDWKCPEWIPILRYVGFTGPELVTADRVLWAESRCDNTAVNEADCWCGFQIHRPSWKANLREAGIVPRWEEITADPVICAAAAFYISATYGWHQWSTY